MPFATVNQTVLAVSAVVPTAILFPVVHAAVSPGPSVAVPAAFDPTGLKEKRAARVARLIPKFAMLRPTDASLSERVKVSLLYVMDPKR
jgi:hypothetical protein